MASSSHNPSPFGYLFPTTIHPDPRSYRALEPTPSQVSSWEKSFLISSTNSVDQPFVLDFPNFLSFNSELHRIIAQLHFCGDTTTAADFIEKALSTVPLATTILSQQYCNMRFKKHSSLMSHFLLAEKHRQILLCNVEVWPAREYMLLPLLPLPHLHFQLLEDLSAISKGNPTSNLLGMSLGHTTNLMSYLIHFNAVPVINVGDMDILPIAAAPLLVLSSFIKNYDIYEVCRENPTFFQCFIVSIFSLIPLLLWNHIWHFLRRIIWLIVWPTNISWSLPY